MPCITQTAIELREKLMVYGNDFASIKKDSSPFISKDRLLETRRE